MIEINRYFHMLKHPMGDGIYMKIGLEFNKEEDAERFRTMDMDWKDGIEAIEVTENEYLEATEDEDEI